MKKSLLDLGLWPHVLLFQYLGSGSRNQFGSSEKVTPNVLLTFSAATGLSSISLPLLYNALQYNGPHMKATFEFHVETLQVSRLQYLFNLITYEMLKLSIGPVQPVQVACGPGTALG